VTGAGTRRVLIVNADDFGRDEAINRGVLRGVEEGIVRSASLMVRWPAAAHAARSARGHPEMSVGLHLDLGEWVYRDGAWVAVYEVVDTEARGAVAEELEHQLALFHSLMSAPPTHLDSHQHVHQREPVRSLMADAAARLGVPLRGLTPRVRHCGGFYGQTGTGQPLPELIAVEALLRIVAGLEHGITELGCHPAEGTVASVYGPERERELTTLCDPRVTAALRAEGIELRSFNDL
jgi:chitin disaccharide deacetylase